MSANTSLSQSMDHINNMWYDPNLHYQGTMRLSEAFNIAGFKPTFPNNTYSTPDFYPLDELGGFCTGVYTTREQHECKRTLQSGLSGESTMANTYVIMYASNYKVRGFSLSTTCTVTNTTTGTGTTCDRNTIGNFTSLSIGDILTGTEPFVLYESSVAQFGGETHTYGGYAGYSFASRRDRQTKKFLITNLSANTANYQILFTATSDSNVTSLTQVASGTITAGSTSTAYSTSTTGNYFIWTSELCVAWQGFAPSGDTVQMYPLCQENRYGFFSQDGHVFATNNAESSRTDAGGGATIKGHTTSGNSANIITSLGTGRDNVYASDGVATTLKGGTYFEDDACVVFLDSSDISSTNAGTIFTAESQADGNGSEMTTFTGVRAHARGCMSGAGAAWVALAGAGYSGSTGQDVVMQFDLNGNYVGARGFTGSASTPPIKKTYFGDGLGTGTAASAGDFFWVNSAVQGWQDTDASDKDESNMIMTNEIELPTPTSLTIVGNGQESAEEACDNIPTGDSLSVYMPSSVLAAGTVIFDTNSATYDSPFNGEQLYWGYADGRDLYSLQIDYNGIVLSFEAC